MGNSQLISDLAHGSTDGSGGKTNAMFHCSKWVGYSSYPVAPMGQGYVGCMTKVCQKCGEAMFDKSANLG